MVGVVVADDADDADADADAAADDEDEYYVLFHCSYNYYCHHELCKLCCYRFDDIILIVVIETRVAHLSQRCRAYIFKSLLACFPTVTLLHVCRSFSVQVILGFGFVNIDPIGS